jgi:hypothetical protein
MMAKPAKAASATSLNPLICIPFDLGPLNTLQIFTIESLIPSV